MELNTFYFFNGLRGIFTFIIVIYHTTIIKNPYETFTVFKYGYLACDGFLFISGFLNSLSYCHSVRNMGFIK